MPEARLLPRFALRTSAQPRPAPSVMDVTLHPAQRAAIDLPRDRPLLVLGEAGHGKTTVLLHRVARLFREGPRPLRAAILVPHEGLVNLLQPLLRRLGVDL